MDNFNVSMVLLSNSASSFVINLQGVEAENPIEAGQKAILHVLQNGAMVIPSAGMQPIHIKPCGAIPFDIVKANLVSVASAMPSKGGLVI